MSFAVIAMLAGVGGKTATGFTSKPLPQNENTTRFLHRQWKEVKRLLIKRVSCLQLQSIYNHYFAFTLTWYADGLFPPFSRSAFMASMPCSHLFHSLLSITTSVSLTHLLHLKKKKSVMLSH